MKIAFTLVLLVMVEMARGEDTVDVYRIDFGPKETCAKGYIPVEHRSSDARFMWKGTKMGMRDRGGDDMLNRDLVHGDRGEFTAGLDNGDYDVEITFGDKSFAHGPFNVLAQGKLACEKVATKKGEFVAKTFKVRVTDEKLRIEIVPVGEAPNFTVTSMIVRGKKQMKAHTAYDTPPPPKAIPTVAELEAAGKPDPKKALKTYCDWLLAHQTKSGFFNQNSSEWYRTSYPLRTLLAGYDIFGEKRYLDAVTVCLDKLLSEQLPNAAWASGFRNKPISERTQKEVEQAMGGTTNTADVGSISTCLAVAYAYVDNERKAKYLDALKRYAEDYCMQWQLASGGFTNGRWQGKDMTTPYSVATGTQGMSFCALYAITGDEKYLKVAERAAKFLLDNWKEDGRPIHHHHAKDTAYVAKVTSFGDIYYYHEAILWVWHWTKDEKLKDRIRQVYSWHIKGEEGLLHARENAVWWPVSHPWTNSKAAAMPLVLIEYDRSMAKDPEVHEAVERCEAFLCNPDFSKRIGVMCEPDLPWGEYSMAATGFGGLTLAELVKPGVIFLKAKR
ncbi:MAG: hypothetical protein GXP25_20710 [Planctomycetes bacterium]|nr:hypothetical protein [Planctomycetota bacterium]